ncbi:MAG: hypothetical protein Q9222_001799 [Ikaeria aurantiellina]
MVYIVLRSHSLEEELTAARHYQLKNFISTADDDIIYYASGHEVWALHLSTRKRESIATLPWKAQCLDARYGWICVGGPNNGCFASIDLNGKDSSGGQERSYRHEAEVDALLPLDLDPDSRMLAHGYFRDFRPSSSPSRRKPVLHVHETGGSIMNSVTINRLQRDRKGQDGDVVCVMTNNDYTVRIFSLGLNRTVATLPFSTMMNHASISPDGQLLVAVGDEPKAFFCRRKNPVNPSADEGNMGISHTWQEIAEPRLRPASSNDACFTTAFSPSGHICAVAQQSGVVTIFETSLINEDMGDNEAVLGVLRSSRASIHGDYVGAVRSMSFSPAPWDLLAWAEDRGRICVTDLRNACRSRQTVDLDLDCPSLDRATLTELSRNQNISEDAQLETERRFLQHQREAVDAQRDLANVSQVAEYIELSAARRRLQRDSAASTGEYDHLTENERQMLDSIRTDDSQENNNSDPVHDSQHRPFSVNYPRDHVPDPSENRLRTQLPTPSSNSSSSSAQLARLDSMRDSMRRNHLDRARTADRSTYQPRRRSSVVISNSNNPSNQSSSSHPSSLAPIGSSFPTLSASPSRLASVVSNAEGTDNPDQTPSYDSSEAWQTVADAMGSTSLPLSSEADLDHSRGPRREDRHREPASSATMIRLLQQQQQQQHLQQIARLERLRNNQAQRSRQVHAIHRAMAGERGYETTDLDMLRRLTETSARREHGVRTMGIGWGMEGREL